MKTTQLAKMEIPAQLVPQEDVQMETFDVSRYAGGGFVYHMKWNTYNYVGAGATASWFALDAITHLDFLFFPLLLITGLATMGSSVTAGLVILLGGKNNIKDVTSQLKSISKPIAVDEFAKTIYKQNGKEVYLTSKGLRIQQKSSRVSAWDFFLPFRFFKKRVYTETTWYNPATDVYLRKRVILKGNVLNRATETFYGPRYEFERALKAM